MRCLFFVVFVYAVRCEDGNYYVIQVPRNEPQRTLKVYWNVPTMQCKSKKVVFENLYQKYGIHQNDGDQFRGEMVTIMYDPGLFPALLKNETSGKFKFRNGGVPQEGDLDKHLEAFRKDLDFSIPDQNFKGIAIIDFESWRPIYRQNFGVLSPYKDVSYEIERKLHWWWPKSSVEAEAKRRFESSARTFMESTISLARQLRPGGVWGFYGFPYCFNMASNNLVERCADKVPEENDRLSWLWRSSTALYPSIYSPTSLSTSQLAALIRGRVREARRVKRGVVLPYFWYRYRDGGFLTQTDLNAALNELYKSNASGFIIWGSSNDVNTLDKCKKLYNYVHNIFGPTIAKYAKKSPRDEALDGNNNITIDKNQIDTNSNATIDLNNRTAANDRDISDEIDTVSKRNSTDDIKKGIKAEIVRKFTNYVPINEDNTSEEEEAVLKNNNVLIDLIINSILNREFNSLSNNKDSTTEYNLINAAYESSLSTKDTVENNNDIDENNSFSNEKQSTTDEGIVSTTESIKITSNDDMQTVDYNYNESHKETTKIATTAYNSDTDMVSGRSIIENDLATEGAVTNSIDEAKDFNLDAYDGKSNIDFFKTLSIYDFTTTEGTKATGEFENIFFNEQDEFVNIFTVDDISTTENILQNHSEKDIFTRINTDIHRNESEFNEIESKFTNDTKFKEIAKEFTEKKYKDVTTESNNDFDSFSETNSIDTSTNSERSEYQNMNTKSNSEVDNQETITDVDEKNSTTNTEDYAVFDETTVTLAISTTNDESKSSIEDGITIVNSQETINYANFDETTATSTAVDSKSSTEYSHETKNYPNFDETTIASSKAEIQGATEDSTKLVKNSHETIHYANFDETSATTIATPKADSKSSTKESTVIVKNSHETINYGNFDETIATSVATPKAESESSTEDSTAVSATEDKVVVYVL